MKKRVIKRIAVLLMISILCGTITETSIMAADQVVVVDESTKTATDEDREDSAEANENNTLQEEVQKTDEEIDDSQIDSEEKEVESNEFHETQSDVTTSTEMAMKYFYIESPYLESPMEQNILVAWGNGNENISGMTLELQKDDGKKIDIPCTTRDGYTYLFTRTFLNEEKGIYTGTDLKYVMDGISYEIDLSDYEIEPQFGVDEEYEGFEPYVSSEQLDDVLETSIVSIDEDGVAESQETIESALKETEDEIPTAKAFSLESRAVNSNKVVVLDPGHGGSDSGASKYGLYEKDFTLKIAQYCKAELEKYSGVTVKMTRTSDVFVGLSDRVQLAKSWGANVFISIHLNSSTSGTALGAEVYYPNSNYNSTVGTQGKQIAQEIQNQLVSLGLKNRGIKTRTSETGTTYPDGSTADYYSVIKNSKLAGFPGIIVEHAFISNASDVDTYLKSETGIKSLGVADAKGIARYLGLSTGQWVKLDGKWYWKEGNNYKKNSWILIDGIWYWLTEDGSMATGWCTVAGTKYYFNSSGTMLTGFQTISNNKYYFNSSGGLRTGWISNNGYFYYADEQGIIQTGYRTVDGKLFQFNTSGRLIVGWLQNPDTKKWYYVLSNHTYSVGWRLIGQDYYYFKQDGMMLTGWLTLGTSTYYMNSSGAMLKGLKTIAGEKYYFASGGVMYKNRWVTIGSAKYYLTADGTAMTSGWHEIGGNRYLFNDNCAVVTSGWTKVNGTYYYINTKGNVYTGWLYQGGVWYYLNPKANETEQIGYMQKGWLKLGTTTYYMNSSGVMQTGLKTIDGKKYYFASGGAMYKNCWVTIGSVKYYLTADGTAMTSGWHEIGGHRYLFNDNCAVVTSGWTKVNGTYYYINTKGNVYTGWLYQGGVWYYLNPKANETEQIGYMQKGWLKLGTTTYYMNSSGVMQTGLKTIDGKKYYFASGGAMYKNRWVTIGSAKYYLTADGTAMTSGWHEIGGNRYLFNDNCAVVTSGWTKNDGVWYYLQNSQIIVGWRSIGGIWYYFSPTASGDKSVGYMKTGWLLIGDNYYYLNSSGEMQTGWEKINGVWYYMHTSGVMAKGWIQIGKNWYYFEQSGMMVCNGWKKIGNTYYYFVSSGEWDSSMPQSAAPKEGFTEITGGNERSIINKMVSYFQVHNSIYPSFYTKNDLEAKTIYDFCELYYEEASAENIRAEVAFCQAMKETGWLKFGGDVKISQYNFAGIGAVGGGVSGATFQTARLGIRAQIQHLQAYATPASCNLTKDLVDPRYKYVSRGSAPYVENLGGKWAVGANYGYEIVKMMNLLSTQ